MLLILGIGATPHIQSSTTLMRERERASGIWSFTASHYIPYMEENYYSDCLFILSNFRSQYYYCVISYYV